MLRCPYPSRNQVEVVESVRSVVLVYLVVAVVVGLAHTSIQHVEMEMTST